VEDPVNSSERFVKKRGWIISVLSISAASLLFIRLTGRKAEDGRPVASRLTFEELSQAMASRFTSAELEDYSQKLKGTSVRWKGQVRGVDSGGRVFVSIGDSPSANVEFHLPPSVAGRLKREGFVSFTGQVSRLGAIEAFPPMPGIYVYLDSVEVEEPSTYQNLR